MRNVLALAAAAGLAAPALAQFNIVGVTGSNQRIFINQLDPGSATPGSTLIGLSPGENVLGLDQRYFAPAFPLSVVTNQSRVYLLGAGGSTLISMGPAFTPALDPTATGFGIDINPTVDRIRVVDSNGGNRRLNPVDGSAVATDTSLTYNDGSGLIPRAVGTAYTNPSAFSGPPAPGTVRQFIVDSARDMLGEVGSLAGGNPSFNGGIVTPIGLLGIDLGEQVGFDILAGDSVGYLSNVVGNETFLYTVNLQTGAATLVGEIGNNLIITDFTFIIPAPSAAAMLGLGALAAVRRRR